jgi:sugar O-acyltransferase (sialic acid O-acetyltransferase NeuD family)
MNVVKDLIIVGGGGFAREVVWLARECGAEWNLIGILDSHTNVPEMCGVPVLGGDEKCLEHLDAWYVIAVGSPRIRQRIASNLSNLGVTRFATLVHPGVLHSQFVTFGEGSIICAGCILTTQITIGRHNIINLGVSVGHDTTTGDFCTISPLAAISGNVTLEDGAEIGTNATIVQGLTVTRGSLLGAGSTLAKSMESPDVIAVGSPARSIKTQEPFPTLN